MSEITRVVLYKHGVGYFEREAEVRGNAEIRLGFRAEEMNDVLKSLTVFDSGGGSVSSVSYDNQKPIERRLEETSLNIPSDGGQVALLRSVRGASVVVSAGNRMISGQVVGVDERRVQVGQGVADSVRLTLLDEGGALHSFEFSEISNVRFLDEHLKNELQHVLETLLSATKRDTKNLKLFAKGEGERKLAISYVVECPVWKTSYRMAISEDDSEKPYLQGWALVDNPQDEDWTDVQLSLVSGLPISFTHDLYSPRYLKRTEIEVKREAAAAPVMPEAAFDLMESAAPAPSAYGGGGPVGGVMRAMSPKMAPPSRGGQMAASQKVKTVTQSVGELFEYRIDQPVTVLRNQSALVPIVGSPFEGGRKILYNQANREANPFSVVDFKNSTGLTLEGGPLTVYEGDVYAGEAMLDTLGPNEVRMVPYAIDLSVEVKVQPTSEEFIVFEALRNSIWEQRRASYTITKYRLHNKSERAKELVLEHPIEDGTLVRTPAPLEESRSFWRFAVALPPKTTTEFSVTVRSEYTQSQSFFTADPSWVLTQIQHSQSREKLKELTEKLQIVADQMAEVSREQSRVSQETQEIVSGQARLRENLAQLGQSHDEARLRARYVATLESQEDELSKLSHHLRELSLQREELTVRLRKLVEAIDYQQLFEE